MIGVFLDDERFPQDVFWLSYPKDIEWRIVRNKAEFMAMVESLVGQEYVISFDHDLQDFDEDGNERKGYDCLKALVEMHLDSMTALPACFFHSKNGIGHENMACLYENAKNHINQSNCT